MPDLRILYTTTELNSRKMVVLIVGYGLRSGCFVRSVPGLTSHSLTVFGTPKADSKGEITLLGFGADGVVVGSNGVIKGLKGRLFIRYVGSD